MLEWHKHPDGHMGAYGKRASAYFISCEQYDEIGPLPEGLPVALYRLPHGTLQFVLHACYSNHAEAMSAASSLEADA